MSKKLFLTCLIIAVLLFFYLVVLVEADYEGWIQSYGETGLESGSDLIETSDGGFAIAGGALLIKTDGLGVVPEYYSFLFISSLIIVTLIIISYLSHIHLTHK